MAQATQGSVPTRGPSWGATRLNQSDVRALSPIIGAVAVIVPLLYILSDVLEVAQGGHNQLSLVMTYLGEAPTVFFILGLYAVQRPRVGWTSLVGAVLYGFAFVFWSGFTFYGIFTHAPDLPALAASIGPAYWINAVVQSIGGVLFGWAVIRARVLPGWTGWLLILAMALHALLSMLSLPESYRWIGSTAQNVAFISMGLAVLFGRTAYPD